MKKHLTAVCLTLVTTAACLSVTYAQKMNIYKNVLEQEIEVTADILNIRTGPGLNYPVVGTLERGEALTVIGTLDEWYIVLLPDNSVGVVSGLYTRVRKMGDNPYAEGDSEPVDTSMETDDERLFYLVNQTRINNDLPPFIWDEKLNRIAELKAADMTNSGYFGHDSPSYGTPYTMLINMDVLYKSATENIARNTTVDNAHLEIMSSLYHRVNILSARYNRMGVGVADSNDWGKIIVQLFIEE